MIGRPVSLQKATAMTRFANAALAATLLSIASIPAAAEGASLTRIEPHGVYGATTTVENGVRVTRTLPPTGTVIINPGNATPLNLRIDQYPNNEPHEHHRR
jgi:hypothetical protein